MPGKAAAAILAGAGAIGNAVAAAFPLLDGLAREVSSKEAAKLRESLNMVLNEYNLKISQLRNEIERRGLNYNTIMDNLSSVSVAGRAQKVKEKATHDKAVKDRQQMSQINKLQNQADQYSAIQNKKIDQTESRGLFGSIKTIFGNIVK